jgi:predicted DNA-binding protein with PD1-like motif
MCPFIDSQLFDKKSVKKTLTLSLSEGEDILSCIKRAMKDNGIRECTALDVNGRVKFALINFFERNKYKTIELKDKPLLRASGTFKLSFDDLWGSMHISTAEKKLTTGTLVKGTAAEGLEIKLSFFEMPPECKKGL